MGKHEFPPFVMVIENGRLVPANPHDAERLNSYRRGTKVFVRFTEEKDRVLVRKWFAIIGLVLKTCETPWKNKEEAHEAIKLALGIVNLSKTVGGAFMQYPKSLTELTDPELQDALEQMTELLSRMTGVDVETLKKETAHVGHEDFHDTGAISTPVDATAEVPSVGSQEDGGRPASDAPSSSIQLSPSDRGLLIECCAKFMSITVDEDLETPQSKRGVLASSKDMWKSQLRPELHEHLKGIFLSADAIIKGEADRAKAIAEFSYWLECAPEELGGAA